MLNRVAEYVGPDRSLILDDSDMVLWLCRMLVGEGGKKCSMKKASAMLWAVTNRFLLWPGRKHYIDIVQLIRAFSQPINPRWMKGGDLAKRYANTVFASAARLARRNAMAKMPLHKIPNHIYGAVLQFAYGDLELPTVINTIDRRNLSNWASLKSTPIKYPHGIRIDGDWFFEDNSLDKWTVYRIINQQQVA